MASYGQPSQIDSVRGKIATQQQKKNYNQDTSYILNVAHLAHLNYSVNADSAFYFARLALSLSTAAAFPKGIAESERQIGNAYMLTGDMTQAIEHYQRSLTLSRQINNAHLIAASLSNIGLSYISMGKYDEAIDYITQSYRLAEDTGDSLLLAGEQSNLADIYYAKKEFNKAYAYGRKALQTAERLNDRYYAAFLQASLGNMLVQSGSYKEAWPLLDSALHFYNETKDHLGLIHVNLQLAKLYNGMNIPGKAIASGRTSLERAMQSKTKKEIAEAAEFLADVFEQTGESKKALQYLRVAKKYSDSLMNDQIQSKLYDQAARYNYEQKELAYTKAQEDKNLEAKHVVAKQRQAIFVALFFIAGLGVIIVLLNKSKNIKQQSNLLLQQKNREIVNQKEEIEQQAAALQQMNAQKNRLFSIIAHDLRGPLSSLQGLLRIFKDGDISVEKAKTILANLNANIDGTVSMVTNLLSWASSQLDAIQPNPRTLLLYGIADRAVASVCNQADEKGIKVTNKIATDTQGFGDTDMVELVIRNLLSNAVKYCSKGDDIWLTADTNGTIVTIGIHDTGIGMPAEFIRKIEQRESFTTYGTSKEKGTGLGLLLCRDFIARNNGDMHIESTQGAGSHFYVSLPLPQHGMLG